MPKKSDIETLTPGLGFAGMWGSKAREHARGDMDSRCDCGVGNFRFAGDWGGRCGREGSVSRQGAAKCTCTFEVPRYSDFSRDDVMVYSMQVLTDSSFEHDTQSVTGATTGDWFVEFYAPWV